MPSPPLPPPTVEVVENSTTNERHVVVSRPNAGGNPVARTYPVIGTSEKDRLKDAVEKVLGDPYSAEWIPRG